MPEYQRARRISVYLSMPSGEVLTTPIVQHALRHDKMVFVPYIHKKKSKGPRSLMDMVQLHSEQDLESLIPDRWGIPSIDSSSIPQRTRCLNRRFENEAEHEGSTDRREDLDLVVVPGVAFDKSRHRLGHGKGFYDIFLSQYRECRGSDLEEVHMPYLGAKFRPLILRSN